jgi:hypothetical protein
MNARWADALTDVLMHHKKASLPRAGAKFVARSVVDLFAVILEGVGEGAIHGKAAVLSGRSWMPRLRSSSGSWTADSRSDHRPDARAIRGPNVRSGFLSLSLSQLSRKVNTEMECPGCGCVHSDDANICPDCGRKINFSGDHIRTTF